MKKTKKSLYFFIVFIFISSYNYAQDRVVYGVVHTLDSIPLIGAEIKVKSTKLSEFTDSLGFFSVMCNSKDKFKITADGFYNQNVKISPKIQVVAVNMKLKPGEENRKYAIGYGYVSEKDKTTAVSNIDNEDTEFMRYSSIADLIRSMGVQVINGEVIVRGSTSFQGSSAALIVVDGVIHDSGILNTLSPIEVKTIDIIKDGSSSVYGDRGANGVVLIETKKGGDN